VLLGPADVLGAAQVHELPCVILLAAYPQTKLFCIVRDAGVCTDLRGYSLQHPSGLNAHFTAGALAAEFARLRAAAG
jgi:hypothetical protein